MYEGRSISKQKQLTSCSTELFLVLPTTKILPYLTNDKVTRIDKERAEFPVIFLRKGNVSVRRNFTRDRNNDCAQNS